MKTKTNKVPLVGPKGRRELLDRIESIEAQIEESAEALGIEGSTLPQILSEILELATAEPEIPTFVSSELPKLLTNKQADDLFLNAEKIIITNSVDPVTMVHTDIVPVAALLDYLSDDDKVLKIWANQAGTNADGTIGNFYGVLLYRDENDQPWLKKFDL